MYLAITFMCLNSGICNFVFDKQLTTLEVCESRNEAMAQMLNANDEVSAFRTTCVKIPDYQRV